MQAQGNTSTLNMSPSPTSQNQQHSIYDALAQSERITGGSIGLDFDVLPDNILKSLPEKLFKNMNAGLIDKSETDNVIQLDKEDQKQSEYTFNQCHFTYVQPSKNGINQEPKTLILQDELDTHEPQEELYQKSKNDPLSFSKGYKSKEDSFKASHHSALDYMTKSHIRKDDSDIDSILELESLAQEPLTPPPRNTKKSNKQVLQKQQMLLQVQNELCHLYETLKEKNEQVRLKESNLMERELRLKKSEAKMRHQLDHLLAYQAKKTHQVLEMELENMHSKHSEDLDILTKENKRQQNAIKESLSNNRNLRDQNKSLLRNIDELQCKVNQLTSDLRMSRESCERLRKSIANNSIFDRNPKKNSKNASQKIAIATQTYAKQGSSQSDKSKPKLEVNRFMNLLHAVLSTFKDTSTLDEGFDSLLQCFESVLDYGLESKTLIHGESLAELFFSFILEISQKATYSQKFRLTNATQSFQFRIQEASPSLDSQKTRLYYHLILLSGSSDTLLISNSLKALLLEITEDSRKQTFLQSGGLSILFSCLDNSNETTMTIISSILLSLSSDGEWQLNFLDEMLHHIPELCLFLESQNSQVHDNVSIILQKLSKNHKEILRTDERLMYLVHSLLDRPIVSIGGGGDMSLLEMPSLNEPGISEFLSLNLRSLHKNLYSNVPT